MGESLFTTKKDSGVEVAQKKSTRSSRFSLGLLILEQVEVEVILVLELEEQRDGGLIEDEHVEDDVNEVGDDAPELDDACTRRSMRDDSCTRSMRRERGLLDGGGSRLLCDGDLGSTLQCVSLKSGGGDLVTSKCSPSLMTLPLMLTCFPPELLDLLDRPLQELFPVGVELDLPWDGM
jgi:hypothetical protein